MSNQPTLPAEGTYTDAEQTFVELSPPGLWPENQDSNAGQFRKVVTDILQECIDEIDHLGEEMFVNTSVEYLPQWEDIVKVPISPAGKTDSERQAIIKNRLKYGPFTRARVNALIESYLNVTFGEAISLTPIGVDLPAGGTPLYSGVTDMLGAYRVYEDVRNYAYEVWIKSAITPDIASMTKELNRITPAGLTVTIDNSKANVLDYFRTVRNKQPVGYWRFGQNFNDSSGYSRHFPSLAWTQVSSLISTAVGGDSAYRPAANVWAQHTTFNQWLFVSGEYTVEGWFRPGALAAGEVLYISAAPWVNNGFMIYLHNNGGLPYLYTALGNNNVQVGGTLQPLNAASVYHIVIRRGQTGYFDTFLNGVKYSSGPVPAGAGLNATTNPTFEVGANAAVGEVDEVAAYNYALSDAQILENYRTGMNLP